MEPQIFENYSLRVELLDVDSACFWTLRLPDWHTLAELNEILATALEWSDQSPYVFVFPQANYHPAKRSENDSRRVLLSEAFAEADSAFYRVEKELPWTFVIRRTRIYTSSKATIGLLQTSFPPGDCSTPQEYQRRLEAGELRQGLPLEELERRFLRLERVRANWIGPYRSQGMSLFQLVVAALLERAGRPADAEELTARLRWADLKSSLSPAAINRLGRRAPLVDVGGRLGLDQESPEFAKVLSAIARFRDPEGSVKLLVRRFTSANMLVEDEPPDVTIVIDEREGMVHGVQVSSQKAGLDPLLEAVRESLEKMPQTYALAVDDEDLQAYLQEEMGLPVEFRFCLEAVDEPFQALEQHAVDGQGYSYPQSLPAAQLAQFCAAAERYYLLAPWSFVGDDEPFLFEGLGDSPLYAIVLGNAHQVYGLSLFQDIEGLRGLLAGDGRSMPYVFMDYLEASQAFLLCQTLDRERISYLDRDTCPFAYGGMVHATAEQFRLLTEVLLLLAETISSRLGAVEGTQVCQDTQGREVRVSWSTGLLSR